MHRGGDGRSKSRGGTDSDEEENAKEASKHKKNGILGRVPNVKKQLITKVLEKEAAEQIRLQELHRAMKQINNGKDPTEILGEMSKSLTNKLIHSPTSAIRQASRAGRREIISNLKEIYEISDLNTAKSNEVSKKTTEE